MRTNLLLLHFFSTFLNPQRATLTIVQKSWNQFKHQLYCVEQFFPPLGWKPTHCWKLCSLKHISPRYCYVATFAQTSPSFWILNWQFLTFHNRYFCRIIMPISDIRQQIRTKLPQRMLHNINAGPRDCL